MVWNVLSFPASEGVQVNALTPEGDRKTGSECLVPGCLVGPPFQFMIPGRFFPSPVENLGDGY